MPPAGHAQRPLSPPWRPQHGTTHAGWPCPQPPRPLEARRPLGRGHGPPRRRPRPGPPHPHHPRPHAHLRWAWGSSLEFVGATRKGEPQRRRDAEMPCQRHRPRIDCDFEFLARAQLTPSFPSQWRRTAEHPRLGLSAPQCLCGSPSFLRWAWGSSFKSAISPAYARYTLPPPAPALIRLHRRLDLCPPAGHGVHRLNHHPHRRPA